MTQTSNEIKTVIDGWISGQLENVHTCLPGKIISYSPGSNRASVQPQGNFKAKDGRSIGYPVIHNVPLQFPCGAGGTAGITFPIQPGDGCILVFSESQNDDFCGGNDASQDQRRHSLNDAIAIPGLYSGGATSSASHSNDTVLTCSGSTVKLSAGGFAGSLADGTSFSIGGGDLVVNGISLVHHIHTGDSGGTTSPPIG